MFKKLGAKLKEQKGFTLIELLAVIVILGIIAAIAIPAISNVINKSQAKSEAQEGIQIINAAKLYVANENIKLVDELDIPRADLMEEYLDRVDSDDEFVVIIQESAASSGVFTYTLTEHPSVVTDAGVETTAITEQDLIEHAK
jgi:type IV pilus assembly protein PilA